MKALMPVIINSIFIIIAVIYFYILFGKRIICYLLHEKHFKIIESHTSSFLGRTITTYKCDKCGIKHTYKSSIGKPWGG